MTVFNPGKYVSLACASLLDRPETVGVLSWEINKLIFEGHCEYRRNNPGHKHYARHTPQETIATPKGLEILDWCFLIVTL
jgi:hypothetical protein